jgi:hypothetical protein
MSNRHIVPLLLAGALALAFGPGCGDDETPTGGTTTGGNNLSIPSGTYQLSGEFFVCGETVPYDASIDTMAFCGNEIVDDFFGYDCPVKRNGNNLSVSCTITREVFTGCNETAKLDITGTVSGGNYELMGTIKISGSPADCWDGSYCDSLYIMLTFLGPAPTACSYADENTVALNVVGGPQAGNHILDASGFSDPSGGSYAYYFGASTSVTVAASSGALAGGPSIYLTAQTDYIDPTTLPQTLPAVIQLPDASASAGVGGPEVYVGYFENSSSGSFYADAVVSGNFVVQELDANHIAGNLNVIVSGTQYTEANPGGVASQRTLTGGYHVTDNGGVQAVNTATDLFAGFANLLRERRQ